jgi:hypothetical protein
LFLFNQLLGGVSWRDGKTSHHGASVRRFLVTTRLDRSRWLDEAWEGRLGYFLTGDAADSALWRVTRLESDTFNRSVFTLTPVRMAADLPAHDFSTLRDPPFRAELTQQYQDLCRSVTQHAYRDVATKARNIVEGLVSAQHVRCACACGKDRCDKMTFPGLVRAPGGSYASLNVRAGGRNRNSSSFIA